MYMAGITVTLEKKKHEGTGRPKPSLDKWIQMGESQGLSIVYTVVARNSTYKY